MQPETWLESVDRASLPAEAAAALEGARPLRVEVRSRSQVVCLYLEVQRRVPLDQRPALTAAVAASFLPPDVATGGFELVPQLARPPFGAPVEELLADAWPDVVAQAKQRLPRVNGILDQATPQVVEDRVEIAFPHDALRDVVAKAGGAAELARLIRQETGLPVVRAILTVLPPPEPAASDMEPVPDDEVLFSDGRPLPEPPPAQEGEPDHIRTYFEQHRAREAEESFRPPDARGVGAGAPAPPPGAPLRGRAIPPEEPARPIPHITRDLVGDRVVIAGSVCFQDSRDTRAGKVMVVFHITDFVDTIACRFFRDPNKDEAIESRLLPGAWVRVRGKVDTDQRTGEVELRADDIILTEVPLREDTAPEKRVELHLHTTMSAMDGLCDPEAAVRQAYRWGHGAVAITDHGVTQAFTTASHVKGVPDDFKVIFGCEAYVVDDGVPVIARAPAGLALADAEYVVLDIETTGFSAIGDDIIEIGAVRMRGTEMGESFQTFIRPTKALSDTIQGLTGITPEMLKDAPEPAAALEGFLAWCGDAIMVAHNATFDYSFLRYHREKYLGRDLQNPVLDTLTLGRSLLTHLKRHGLADMCKDLGVPLENHHRADADARTAAMVLIKLLERVQAEHTDVTEVAHLNHLTQHMNVQQIRPHHATLLVQHQSGMKNLYRLISLSHTEYFHRTPRVPRTRLEDLREGLLIGSGCLSGALFQALMRGAPEPELLELAGWYDFLEIQPPSHYQRLIEEGQLQSTQHLHDLVRRICELGRQAGKPVVATGDVHFLEPHQQNLRQILKADLGWRDDTDAPCYFRTTDEMLAEFDFLGAQLAREVVITNSRLIAGMLDRVHPVPDKLFAPEVAGAEAAVRDVSWHEALAAYGDPLPDRVRERLERELGAIIGHNFAVVYYISHLLVKRSNEMGYLVGSRGSVGSSLVAWCMGITEVNALPPHYVCRDCHWTEWFDDGSVGSGYDLPHRACPQCGSEQVTRDGQDIPFETFMGFKGDKVPDIDLNFSGEVQSRIQQYSMDLLGGPSQVFKAGTVGTIAQKTAFGIVRGWMESQGVSLREAEIQRRADGLTGVKRTTGQHPGGMVVVPVGIEVEEVTPVQYPADARDSAWRTTHYDYHSFEQCLLKLDILGHDDPTTLRMLSDMTGVPLESIPLDDPDVLALFRPRESLGQLGLQEGDFYLDLGTVAVPEFGTEFVRRMLQETLPRQFSDLVRISGLSHGTDVWTHNAQELIRKGVATLQTVIPTRDDIMVYLMHKKMEPALAFKIMESVRKGRGLVPEWEEEMRRCGVPEWYIWSCKQIKYMFPKAHAVAYCISSFRVAYFKVHHPRAFYAAYFTVRAGGAVDAELLCRGETAVMRHIEEIRAKGKEATPKEKDALVEYEVVLEALRRGIGFSRVDLLQSHALNYQVLDDGSLLCPFNALSGLGDNAARAIVDAREAAPFQSIEDLKNRARLNKSIIELLSNHGCLKGLPEGNQLQFAF